MTFSKSEKKIRLINLLERGKSVSGEIIAEKLGMSRQALHKQIQILREEGYIIVGRPKSGYSFKGTADLLLPEEVMNGLGTKAFGKSVVHYDVIGSTQDAAKKLAESGEKEGAVVVAEEQIAGRGRRGSRWSSGRGGIWASIILRPRISPQKVVIFPLISSMAILEAIEEATAVRCLLKWPNDIWADTTIRKGRAGEPEYKKVSGILTEMSAESENVNWVVLGFGINVNNSIPPGLSGHAVSLKGIVRRNVDRTLLLKAILKKMELIYNRFIEEGFGPLRDAYKKRSLLAGRGVIISDLNRKIEGECADIDLDGSLVLLTRGGKREKFLAGDVTLKKAVGVYSVP